MMAMMCITLYIPTLVDTFLFLPKTHSHTIQTVSSFDRAVARFTKHSHDTVQVGVRTPATITLFTPLQEHICTVHGVFANNLQLLDSAFTNHDAQAAQAARKTLLCIIADLSNGVHLTVTLFGSSCIA